MHSVRLKIASAFCICLLITIVVGLAGGMGMSRIAADLRGIYGNNTVPIIQMLTMQAMESDIRRQLRRMQVERDVDRSRQLAAELQRTRQEMDRNWNAYYPGGGISSDTERQIAERIAVIYPQYQAVVDRAVAALQAGDFDAAKPVVDAAVPIAEGLHKQIRLDVEDNFKQAQDAMEEGERDYQRMLYGMSFACLSGLLFIVMVNLYLFRVVSRPLNEAVHHMQRIATGALGGRIAIRSRDEFSHLLTALGRMSEQLSGIVGRIQVSSDNVASSSEQIRGSNADLAERTRQQTASIEQARSSLSGLLKAVDDNVGSAREATMLAADAAGMARSSNEAVSRMMMTMNDIRGSSSKIADITTLIESIAFQTNILALNAAVEAARAGEQGRGFAVVASEVRNLAQRASAAAKEIKELIETSVSTIQHGVGQAQEVGKSVADMQQTIQKVAGINAEIVDASEQQQRGVSAINDEVTQIEQLARKNVALVTDVAEVAQALAERAAAQRQEMAVFTLS
ncbi:MCP four helix bundle domain-containing protein [Herbaspirillum sp. LeCh32-8]|uniref:methyl-accepting chemotaxis protein n=1 Tax=Herbaspirillum sp. LeCh32-8 TaxID=2821356 RepID=UPI001AE66DDD|nr:methyl-accepting chemotaxis protein [Herbaspirillum sp. LeCh32-8]MBP0599273.1 MCP four helix bundle domain-containing protein [Herbaspirillum sp. LeCh32-8]